MLAFEVSLNGKKLCLAGIGDDGVLSAGASWVTGTNRAELFLDVGGLLSPVAEYVFWVKQKSLRVGDEVEIKIIEADSVDTPKQRKRDDPARRLRAKKGHVRETAKQLGWKIVERPKPTAKD